MQSVVSSDVAIAQFRFLECLLFSAWALVLPKDLLNDMLLLLQKLIALGVFDQDVSARYCLKFPILYQEGIQNVLFSWQSYNRLDVERRLQCSYYLLHLHNNTKSSILQ
ncbi:hypothetical protein K7X08_031454 [Anisodus acutangulus]|uniref:P-type ATPase C-terminal domain-containing protein n=1 Tax=Anisodus acutangulus TaxID=402998 RepID=A0A9Q1MRP5_9SOLA|nr:hypothetical protein K7X08_031454 [Anisodus acutangulus]